MNTETITAVLSRILSEKYGVEVILKLKEEKNGRRLESIQKKAEM